MDILELLMQSLSFSWCCSQLLQCLAGLSYMLARGETPDEETKPLPQPVDRGKRKIGEVSNLEIDDLLRFSDFVENPKKYQPVETHPVDPNYFPKKEKIKQTSTVEQSQTSQTSQTQQQPSSMNIDLLNKRTVAQGGTYLDLSKVSLSEYEKSIDEWVQSMFIVITNYKDIWNKERFLNYFCGIWQGDALKFLKK
ncbi:uncharacterized protein LOC111284889 [Durio zibethinus]|uniref:Uncharacterized protein LOC111284889 n=1 Tax=Durio zibethinus TaxID=66656 RepID=A0A6P5XP51_DURZI|nr:uncharacterized protein LOC111284889 [Durio zibethinus]